MKPSSEQIQAINTLLADPDFQKLASWEQTINPFGLTGLNEMGHSTVIQWLLSPNDSHGLGDRAFKALLHAAYRQAQESGAEVSFFGDDQYSPLAIEALCFNQLQVFTEHPISASKDDKRRLDLLVIDAQNSIAVVIENKYGARETDGQLQSYMDWSQKALSEFEVLHIHLDACEKFHASGEKSEQWVELNYDWIEENLLAWADLARGSRASQLIKDYYYAICEDELHEDPHFSGVSEAANALVHNHPKTMQTLKNLKQSYSDTNGYIAAASKSWGPDTYLSQVFMKYEFGFELLLETGQLDLIIEQVAKRFPDCDYGNNSNGFSIQPKSWASFMKKQELGWPLYYWFETVESKSEEGEDLNEPEKYLKLRLQFANENLLDDKEDKVQKAWEAITGKELDFQSIKKTKSFLLEDDIPIDASAITDVLARYLS